MDNNGNGSKGNTRFKTIWAAIGYVPPQGQSKRADILRRESTIVRKLKQLSITSNDNQRNLKEGDQKLILEQSEIEMIREKIEAFPFWNPLAEETAADIYDWLGSGKEVE